MEGEISVSRVHTGKSAVSLPIPKKSLLRRDFSLRGSRSCRMPDCHCEDTTGHRDEGNFAQICAKCGEEFLGELNRIALAFSRAICTTATMG
jgi:hypothetical protein